VELRRNIGAFDVDSPHGPIVPWLRSIDGFNTHDDAFELSMSGGVTSAQILPGSGNAIGAFRFRMTVREVLIFCRRAGLHGQTSENLRKLTIVNDHRTSS
jgi:hypothetical protein